MYHVRCLVKHHPVTIFFVCMLLSRLAGCQASTKLDWRQINDTWKEYVYYPSAENAENLIALLPETWIPTLSDDESKIADDILGLMMNDIGMLERQVYSRDRLAVRIAFRLTAIASGALQEELCEMLGCLIRIDPELFLEELNTNRQCVPNLASIVTNPGRAYIGRHSTAIRLEYGLRIQALKTIDDPVTAHVHDECLLMLENRL